MLKYIIKHLLILLLLLAGAIFIVFAIIHLSPGDRAYGIGHVPTHEQRGFNDPLLIQYARYMAGVFRGDFGNSFRNDRPIADMLATYFPHTLRLSLATLSVALLLALPLGIIAALKRDTWIDGGSMFITLIGISMPVMWLGLLLILFHALNWGMWGTRPLQMHFREMRPFIAFTLGVGILSAMIRTTRFSMLETIEQNYIRTARAKGLSDGEIIRKHVLPNIIIPVLASFKVHLGTFFTGIILAEAVFLWPGIGRLMVISIAARDYFTALACIIVFIFFFALLNFAIDIIKAFADPRIRA